MFVTSLAVILFVVLCFISSVFFLAQIIKNNGILDIFWGLGFVLCIVLSLLLTANTSQPSLLVSLCVTLWGIRLAYHIGKRNIGKAEDKRYVAFRNTWKRFFLIKSYVNLFLLQGVLLFVISLSPIVTIFFRKDTLQTLDLMGISIWVIGFFFEVVGDWQLSQFKKNPANKGKIMTRGLWKFTRHPNYFGEAVMWWGIWVFSIPTPYGLFTLISPILITTLLLKVSGVTMLEQRYKGNNAYENYKKETPAFFPKIF